MRQKLVTKTYMREVVDYEMVIINHASDDYALCIKKINKVTDPFILEEFGKKTTHIDDGYYIVEATPSKEYYNARVYLDQNKNIIDYYFDISNGNGEESKVPYYDDLYLDVLYYPNENNLIQYSDMDELEDALHEKKITQEEFDKAINAGEKLKKELEDGSNFFLHIDFKTLIEKYFNS